MTENYEDFRSHVYSILKCDYGWNKVIPSGMDVDIDDLIKAGYEIGCNTIRQKHYLVKYIASYIKHYGGEDYFAERIDGKPNTLIADAAFHLEVQKSYKASKDVV